MRTSLPRAAGTLGNACIGFFECVEDYAVAEALFDRATAWAQEHALVRLLGTYNLDREESRGILIEGRDRPPAVYCGHNPPYYSEFLEKYGFTKFDEDGLAYAIDLDLNKPEIQHLMRLAEQDPPAQAEHHDTRRQPEGHRRRDRPHRRSAEPRPGALSQLHALHTRFH